MTHDDHVALAKKVEEARLLLEEISETVRQSCTPRSPLEYRAKHLSDELYMLRLHLDHEAKLSAYGEIYIPHDARAP